MLQLIKNRIEKAEKAFFLEEAKESVHQATDS
jgi:hypothetical protein